MEQQDKNMEHLNIVIGLLNDSKTFIQSADILKALCEYHQLYHQAKTTMEKADAAHDRLMNMYKSLLQQKR